MRAFNPDADIHSIPPEERLDMIERLWESLSTRPEQIQLSAAQRGELDRRLEQMERDGAAGIPWQRVLEQIRNNR